MMSLIMILKNSKAKLMDPNLKDLLYRELMGILQSLEEGDFNVATMELEHLIKKIQYDQL